jgi:hypothetical protein
MNKSSRALIGRVLAFKDDTDWHDDDSASVQIITIDGDRVQVGFDLPKNVRVYLTISLADLLREVLRDRKWAR